MDRSTLHHANITDLVRDPVYGSILRITDFRKIVEDADPRRPGGPLRKRALNCRPTDPDLRMIATQGAVMEFRNPWDLVWERPSDWSPDKIEFARSVHDDAIDDDFYDNIITSRSYPRLFERFLPLTNHQRMALEAWRLDTHKRIAAYRASHVASRDRAALDAPL